VINKYLKEFKKDKDSNASYEFLGGFFDKEWKDGNYVDMLANVPSKEESLSKLVWLLNYPVQHFAAVLKSVAEKK
jgi:ribosomal protein L10